VNGQVIDGTGRARFRADVGIRGDTVAAVGDLSRATAKITIDARDQVVAPGFIDLLGHSESSVLVEPMLEGKVRQGVTTEVTGEGHSPGPLNDAMIAEANRTRPPGFPEITWHTLAEFMREVEKRGPAINVAFRIGRKAKVPVNIFHLKTGGKMRGHMPEVVAKIEAEQKRGLDVASNVYPYTATSTDLTSIVPAWALEGGYLPFVARIKDPATRAKVATEMRVGDGSTILIRNLPQAPPH